MTIQALPGYLVGPSVDCKCNTQPWIVPEKLHLSHCDRGPATTKDVILYQFLSDV